MKRKLLSLARSATVAALVCLGLSAARGTTVLPPDFPTLVNESDCIVRAVTRSVTAEKRPSARGVKIVTRVEFDVRETIAGQAPATLTLEFLGGRVGDERLHVAGMPQFVVGDENILFVRDAGKSICPLYAMMHGRYEVHQQSASGRKFVTRDDGAALQSIAEISTPVSEQSASATNADAAMTPDTFIQQIKAVVRPDARFNRAQP
jgi:hypothetical protein